MKEIVLKIKIDEGLGPDGRKWVVTTEFPWPTSRPDRGPAFTARVGSTFTLPAKFLRDEAVDGPGMARTLHAKAYGCLGNMIELLLEEWAKTPEARRLAKLEKTK